MHKEEPLTSSDDEEDVEESRKDAEAQKKETVGQIYDDGGKID